MVKKAIRPAIFKWRQTEPELILCAVRWYLRAARHGTVVELYNQMAVDIDAGDQLEQTRYSALKPPIAMDAKAATFVYVDPGLTTDSELRAWGVAHAPLWAAASSSPTSQFASGAGHSDAPTLDDSDIDGVGSATSGTSTSCS